MEREEDKIVTMREIMRMKLRTDLNYKNGYGSNFHGVKDIIADCLSALGPMRNRVWTQELIEIDEHKFILHCNLENMLNYSFLLTMTQQDVIVNIIEV